MVVLRRVRERAGPLGDALAEVAEGWLPSIFGARLRPLPPRAAGERWGLVTFGVLELALGYRAAGGAGEETAFELVHGPFAAFRYDARVEPAAGGARVIESVSATLPWHYGGERAATWALRRLLPDFAP